MSISGTTHQKLVTLRKRLDQMGYYEPLTIEALPLVEQLFSDLIHTTESLKNAKFQSSQIQKEKSNFEKYLEPYKNENAKLVKENNELHHRLIHQKEKFEADIKEVKTSIRTLEHENADLRFLNTQYLQKVHSLEQDSQEKSEMIMQLQEKNAQAVIQTPGGKKCNIPFRRQRMEISEPLPPRVSLSKLQKVCEQTQDVYIADMLQIADESIQHLQKENSDAMNILEQAEEMMKNLEKKVEVREKEIERLVIQLEGGRPLNAVMKEVEEREKDRIIAHLNIQVEHLQHQNQELQNQLLEIEGKSSNLPTTPQQKKQQNRIQDKETATSTYRSRKESVFSERIQKQKTADNETVRKNLQEDTLQQKNKELKLLLTSKDEEQVKLEQLIKQQQQEKDRLTVKISELIANEKDLVMEIDRLSKRTSPRERSPSCPSGRLARLIHLLEAQRDHYKDEVQMLQKILQSSQKNNINARHPSKGTTRIRPKSSTKESELQQKNESSVIKLLEEERDFYKERFMECTEIEKGVTEPKGIVKISVDKEVLVVDEELQTLLREREKLCAKVRDLEDQLNVAISVSGESEKHRIQRQNLEKALEELQKHLDEAQTRIQNIHKEKEDLNYCYQKVLQENLQLRAQSSLTDKELASAEESSAMKVKERTVQHMQIEEVHLHERTKLQQQNEQLQAALLQLQKQENEFQESLTSHKAVITTLQDQISSLQYRLSQVEEESLQSKTAATHIRIMADQGEQSLEQMRQNILKKESELEESDEKLRQLQNTLSEYADNINCLQKEMAELRFSMANLEEEKQQLLKVADEHNKHVTSLQQQMFSKEEHGAQLRITVATLEDHVDKLQRDIREKDQEIDSLKQQIKSYSEDTTKLTHSQEIISRENIRLLDDLATMTRENQAIQQQLEHALQQQEDLKRQIREYVTEVSRIQELLAIKEQQRSELIQQYQNLSQENIALEAQNHHLESQTSTAHLEVIAKDAELKHYKDTIVSLEQEIEEYMASQQAHHMELSVLNTSVNGLEHELTQSRKEADILQSDLSAARALCVQLDTTVRELQKRVVIEESQRNKITSDFDYLQEEVRAMRTQLTSERTQVLSLEGLMASSRETEFRNHLASQELTAELKLVRDRLLESEQKLENQSKDIAIYRTKVAELEMEVDRMKRQITNERFERERANQELRRLQQHHQLFVTQTLESNLQQESSTYPRISIQTPSQLTLTGGSTKASSSDSNKLTSPSTFGQTEPVVITKEITSHSLSETRSRQVIRMASEKPEDQISTEMKTSESTVHSSPPSSTSGIISQAPQSRASSRDGSIPSSTPRSTSSSEPQANDVPAHALLKSQPSNHLK